MLLGLISLVIVDVKYIFLYILVFKSLRAYFKMGIGDYLKEFVKASFSRVLDGVQSEISGRIRESLVRFEQRIIRKMMAVLVIFAAVVFLALAFIFMFVEYFALSKTLAFFFIGVITLLIGIILNLKR